VRRDKHGLRTLRATNHQCSPTGMPEIKARRVKKPRAGCPGLN
jgi:hypothetical protein